MSKKKKSNSKKAKKRYTDISRENLATLSYKLETTFPIKKEDLYIPKENPLTKEEIEDHYPKTFLGKVDQDLQDANQKLNIKIEKLSLDIDQLNSRSKDVSESDKREIISEFEKRRKRGTINENLDELTIELGKRVKAIRRATKNAKKILDSSILKDKNSDDDVSLEEYRVLNLPKRSIKQLFINKKMIIVYAILISLLMITIIALIVLLLVV